MYEGKNWLVEFCEDWSQFFQRCNWYTFRLCLIEVENDAHLGGVEATVVILGLGVRWRWNHTRTEKMQKLLDDVEDIKSGRVETHPIWPAQS